MMIEYVILIIVICLDSKVSFSIFQSAKVMISLLFFLWHYWTTTFSDQIIQYLMGSRNDPCHTMVAIDQKVVLSYFPGELAQEWSSYLVAGKSNQTTAEMNKKSFWAPCLGFALHDDYKHLIENLKLGGENHNWSIVAVYLLSQDKFLSYSMVSYLRWLNWGCLAINMTTYLMYLIAIKQFPEERDINILNYFQSMFYMISELMHIAIVILDKCNLYQSQIDVNEKKSDQSVTTQVCKTLLLFVLLILYIKFGLESIKYLGYLVYFLTCIIVGLVVNELLYPFKWSGQWRCR